ncbi:MAG TPA: hypothetical protein VFU23_07350 [Gemmatimonadales bacterium]|nr:hypothetical protein [Gemmatimonadales bacterium]
MARQLDRAAERGIAPLGEQQAPHEGWELSGTPGELSFGQAKRDARLVQLANERVNLIDLSAVPGKSRGEGGVFHPGCEIAIKARLLSLGCPHGRYL